VLEKAWEEQRQRDWIGRLLTPPWGHGEKKTQNQRNAFSLSLSRGSTSL